MLGIVPIVVQSQNFRTLGVVHIFRVVVVLVQESLFNFVVKLISRLDGFDQFDFTCHR